MMWTDAESGNGPTLRTSLHAYMSAQNHVTHVTPYQQTQCLNLSDGFNHSVKRPRSLLDSQSHRVIEKRRRDRMNNCLADLGQLVSDTVDANGIKHTGQGRIKKTEIIEMAIDRIRSLQAEIRANQRRDEDRLVTGFKECRDVAIRYLVDHGGQDALGPLCTGLLVHLHEHLNSIYRVGPIARQSSGPTTDRDSSTASAAIPPKSTISYELQAPVNEDTVWKQADQIYVKPEAVTPETVALLDEDLAGVISSDLTSRTTANPLLPRRMSEMTGGVGVKSEFSSVVIIPSDDGADEHCWNGAGSNDEDEDDGSSSPHRLPSLQSQQQKIQQQRQMNGGYKYKDSIKRRFCSESDARSWNESASDCSSTVGVGGRSSTVDLFGSSAGDGNVKECEKKALSQTCVVVSPPTSPEGPLNLESLTIDRSSQTVFNTKCSSAPLEARTCRAGCCSCSTGPMPSNTATPSPGFVLHQSGAYYLPVYVTVPWSRLVSLTESSNGNGIGKGDSDDGCCDDDDVDDGETSTSSRQPTNVTCHPVSIPVNFSAGLAPVICGCAVKSKGNVRGRRRVTSEPPATAASSDIPPINSGGRHFPSAPVLLQRV